MSWIDWLIVLVPVTIVYCMGLYSRKYVRSVADFLSAGRVCGRYVISVGDIASGLSIIGLLAYVEVHYKTGFALSFWSAITTKHQAWFYEQEVRGIHHRENGFLPFN